MRKTRWLLFFIITALVLTSCPGIGPETETQTVTYDGNESTGGNVPVDSNNYIAGAMVTVLGNSGGLVRTGYTFSGWNTQSDGGGTDYVAGATFAMGSADVTLYAKWTQNPTYNVTYDGNENTGGSVPVDSNNYEEGAQVTVLGNTGNLVQTGYMLAGWNTEADGSGTTCGTDDTFTMGTADVTLYAQWTEEIEKCDMISAPSGSYTQTDTDSNSFTHNISAFSIAKYEVTYELWYTVHNWALSNGYNFANPGREGQDGTIGAEPTAAKYEPVTTINWRDAIVWCNAYSQMSGFSPVYKNGSSEVIKDSRDSNGTECDGAVPDWSANGYRLPTEGEWQYAASYQDGTNWTPYNYASGATADYTDATATGLVAWYYDNSDTGSGRQTHDVGTKTANQLVINDMSGNVYEWCWDWWGTWPTAEQTDYRGPGSGSVRVRRGGSWYSSAYYLQVGYRSSYNPYDENSVIGFRPMRTP